MTIPAGNPKVIELGAEEPITEILISHETLLTAAGGPFELKPELRQLCALTSDGILYVSAQHQTDAYVMAFEDQLEHENHPFEVKICSMSTIKALYQANDDANGKALSATETKRQAQVVQLLGEAHRNNASDVHFVVGHDITRIFFRIDGLLWEAEQHQSKVGMELCSSLYNSMCDVAKEHYQPQVSQDARVKRAYVEQLGLFGARVATRPLVDGPLMVLRLLYDDKNKMTLEDLGFLPQQIEAFSRIRSMPYGVNLITGPTGSGKSKSQQVNLNLLYQECGGTKHILTMEDPPEYPILANQSPLGAGETWNEGITNTMRLDPDILMYGEIRDLASAQAAFRGGMTGHLVLSTLHTNNAVAALQRLIDMGVDRYLVTDPALMTSVVNQSLLPLLCPHCRVPAVAHLDQLNAALTQRLRDLQAIDLTYLKGPGCPHCKSRGVIGRTVVAETLLTDLKFMRVFNEQGASAARRHWVKEMGGITKTAHTIIKLKQGLVDPRHAETMVGPLDFDRQTLELAHAQ
ncbi:MAG: Flp pilus assembly complex ATPase component TadA [Pseudomonadota bacterium]|jgi:general secretion pathway protein E|uniref:GspE/PulE family protein n=1 Tax=Pseudomonas TaxID=286 RepID=UPI00238A5298|nr:ATPase, T2SS/T4P/T4SS family [Pseudomonas sp.]MDP9217923.1 Flp pilus assembly complex ATPase component TadA [Pseudomonadota bacterium]MDE1912172.1 Flp pilus assembly complex ATPase component TadA [Pseudomonas sp.]MDE2034212.1 Flp pilus assembly complex ATPase component TadA [Pseudomonas sp.]MDE2193040.1 Flp pilus assembly complex ATPase component TadA [Pseudomonas sp.]MDQ3593631.1 Flp pilus assembly complex ATPase component TadA [Pseudomonadota bacterium]